MKLVDSVVNSFRVAKVFRENSDQINSIDIARNGENLISASNDDSIVIYDCANEGKPKRTLYSKKYGVINIKYTHAGNTVIYGSNKVDDSIRFQSLHDNKYIRYYNGHVKRVICLCMSPVDDTFLSTSLDNTIRLWDLRSANCQGMLNVSHPPLAAFDPEGLIFAVGYNSELIKLYDLRSFDKGPFITFRLQQDVNSVWTDVKFSPDGKMIMISSNGSSIKLIDAFNGKPLQNLTGYLNAKKLNLEASFSPDGQYVLTGSQDCQIHVYNTENGNKVAQLDGKSPDPLHLVRFNPDFMMLASASKNLAFWLPTVEE